MKITAFQISGRQEGADIDVVFANNATADTQKNVDIAVPTKSVKDSYKIIVYNPSVVTSLTVKLFSKELLLKAGTRYAYEDQFTVPIAQTLGGTAIDTHVFTIGEVFAGADLRLVISNDVALGAAEGFTTTLRLRELN